MRRKTASLFAKDNANVLLLCQIPATFISLADQVKIIDWVRKLLKSTVQKQKHFRMQNQTTAPTYLAHFVPLVYFDTQ